MSTIAFRLLFVSIVAVMLSTPCAQARFAVERLRCEDLDGPLGIDCTAPRLTWNVTSSERGDRQTAYQILVASSEASLKANTGDLWDTGQVRSHNTLQIPYAGKPLSSSQRCYWKVRAWDKAGKPSEFSPVAVWEMGLLSERDWTGKWIGRNSDTNAQPAPLLRKTFASAKGVRKARVYVCGLGYYELRINGKKIGDHLLDPGYTRYDRRVLYTSYDVTDALRAGKNAIGVMLGTGWYNVHTRAVWDFHKAPWRAAPKLLLQLEIEYAGGRKETIVSDSNWKVSTGPIVFDSIYGGETYDARLERNGWDTADYNDAGWAVAEVLEAPKGKLSAQAMPPIKASQVLRPVRLTEPRPGVFVYDMGQNFAGCAQLNVRGPAGTTVVMKYGERLTREGLLDRADIQQHIVRMDTNQQFQTDTYILKGKGTEHWHSRFTYHGFQYVEVTGFPGKLGLGNLRGIFMHSAVPQAGSFECSNPLLTRILRAGRWAYLSNLQGIPTDCPHREKNGWTGDAHIAGEQGLFNYEPAAVYTKWVNDLHDEQKSSGELPGIVPTSGWGYAWGNGPAWDSAFLLLPNYLYEYCGNSRILVQNYGGLKRYVDYLTTKAKDGIVSIGLNDWAPYKTQTAAEVTSTAYYYRDAQIVALAAKLAGNDGDARKYSQLAGRIKRAFNEKFYHPDTGLYDKGSQTALSCALYQGLVDETEKGRVVQNLVAAVERANWHIDTGILGAKYILNALTENGRADVAYRMASQKDLPSWGWWLEQGGTTLWEQWNGTESRNHIMFGDILAWFYKALAGINPDPNGPGFHHFIIKPHPVGDLTWARATYQSASGPISVAWKKYGTTFDLNLNIPANTSATVYLPGTDVSGITESRKLAIKAAGVTFFRVEKDRTVLEVGSGAYQFSSQLQSATGEAGAR
jgi:alpha-L-rhamnosidase